MQPGRDFALVVGAARSGTTLLRLILDAHPEIGCPAEAGIPALVSHMARVWDTVDVDIRVDAARGDPGADAPHAPAEARDEQTVVRPEPPVRQLPGEAKDWIRGSAITVMERYCGRGGKRLYIDKSLDSVHHLSVVNELFPRFRSVLAFRHVMDTVASGIEASPWGFQAYGYMPYVQATPQNTVAALASYWLDHVTQALLWEQQHPEECFRVRYEDLVTSPEQTVGGVLAFLGVKPDLTVLHGAFDREPPRGPGDYKVEHTSSVHATSIGRGKRVPVTMLPPGLLKAVNEKLEAIGYDTLDRSWNTAERPVDSPSADVWSQRLAELVGQLQISADAAALGSFALVAEDHRVLRWVIDPAVRTVEQGDGEVEGVVIGTAEDLVLMLTEEENLGVLLRSGRIRHLIADDESNDRQDLASELGALVAFLRAGVQVSAAAPHTVERLYQAQ